MEVRLMSASSHFMPYKNSSNKKLHHKDRLNIVYLLILLVDLKRAHMCLINKNFIAIFDQNTFKIDERIFFDIKQQQQSTLHVFMIDNRSPVCYKKIFKIKNTEILKMRGY